MATAVLDGIAQLVCAAFRYGRQAHGAFQESADGQLVALHILPSVASSCPIVEACIFRDVYTFEVLVFLVIGNIDIFVFLVGNLGASYVVVHEFGPHAWHAPADALLLKVVACVVTIPEQFVDGIDDAVAYVVSPFEIWFADSNAFLVGVAREFLICASAVVVEVGEAIEVNTFALLALEDFQEASFAHSRVELHDGDGGHFAVDVVAFLVVVIDEFVGWQTFRKEVIGDELVKKVVFGRVVVVALEFRIYALSSEIIHDVLEGDVLDVFSYCLGPELVGFGKEGEAVIAVFNSMEGCCFSSGFFVFLPYLITLEEVFVGFVAVLREFAEESASMNYLC